MANDIEDRAFKSVIRLHLKVLSNPVIPIDDMIKAMRQVYKTAHIRVDVATSENLNLPLLADVEVGRCVMGSATEEQDELFSHYNNVQPRECVVYFVRSTIPPYSGCAAHPNGTPGCVVARNATIWTLGHEVGHVLKLSHVNDTNNLMISGTFRITNPPPDLRSFQITRMDNSNLTVDL